MCRNNTKVVKGVHIVNLLPLASVESVQTILVHSIVYTLTKVYSFLKILTLFTKRNYSLVKYLIIFEPQLLKQCTVDL